MNRKLRALSLTLFAALALSAVVSASASAVTHDFEVSEKATPTVKSTGAQIFKAETGSLTDQISCENLSATGELPAGANTSVTVTPKYTNCKAKKGETEVVLTIEQNGCDFRFTGKTTTGNPTEGEHAALHIDNHEKTGTECHMETKVTALKLKCISIPNQEIKDAVRYKDDSEDSGKSIIIEVTAHGLESTTTNSAGCPTPGGVTVVHKDGTYKGSVTVSAHNEALKQVPIKLTSTP